MKTATVIIPTYNRESVICTAIDSVLKQTYPTQCIIVDDASTDNTVALLKDKYTNEITVISNSKNKGQAACRNQGAEVSHTDCICFLDSDDTLSPDSIEKRIALFNENNEVNVSFGMINPYFNKEHPLLSKKKKGDKLSLTEYLEDKAWCHNNGFLIDREFFLKNGMYDTRLRNKEDIELLLRLLSKHDFFYCGTEVGQLRDICGENRARYDYQYIIKQKKLFSEIVLNNPILNKSLSNKETRRFICSDIEEELRALYKLKQYKQFRQLYKKAIKNNYINNKSRFLKRFLFSYINF